MLKCKTQIKLFVLNLLG